MDDNDVGGAASTSETTRIESSGELQTHTHSHSRNSTSVSSRTRLAHRRGGQATSQPNPLPFGASDLRQNVPVGGKLHTTHTHEHNSGPSSLIYFVICSARAQPTRSGGQLAARARARAHAQLPFPLSLFPLPSRGGGCCVVGSLRAAPLAPFRPAERLNRWAKSLLNNNPRRRQATATARSQAWRAAHEALVWLQPRSLRANRRELVRSSCKRRQRASERANASLGTIHRTRAPPTCLAAPKRAR